MADSRYAVDYAKRNAKCQKCKQPVEKGSVRLAKIVPNIFSDDSGDMKQYHHASCLFESFKRTKATTKIIEEPGDIEGWDAVKDEDKEPILELIRAHEKFVAAKSPGKAKKASSPVKKAVVKASSPNKAAEPIVKRPEPKGDPKHRDNSFREYRRLVANIAEISSYLSKTELVKDFFTKGSDKAKFNGDLHVWIRLLLPGVVKRIYNLQSKQLVKIFSRIFGAKESAMLTDLEQGDVAETIATFFEESEAFVPNKKATLTVHDVDAFLDSLTSLTKEEEQSSVLSSMASKCTSNDLKMIVRLIKGDLRMQAGAKHILDALHKDAHEAFNSSRQIEMVLDSIIALREAGNPNGSLEVGASLMTPVQPMLAAACKSVDMAFDKCPNGMYSEIKYDGERVQLHKNKSSFKYFSRSLKPVLPHKVAHFKDHIPKAFPDASDLIIDAEVLMVNNTTGNPLPFGTLGVHKAAGFKDATPCLFVFDILYYNGENLMDKPIKSRKKLLHEAMVEVGNNVKFSETKVITKKFELSDMIKDVLNQGLEGLVLKDLKSPYEPGKRHWLKVKKDYLNEGAMADSADLVVLGAWYGSGNRGGAMSIFLMGCHDKDQDKWCTVTKVHTGHDDETLERLQKELAPNMLKIKQDYNRVPEWLDCSRQMTPDFVAKDPKLSPVWEITGAEFSKAELHSAAGISIRFPRVTKIRDDKTCETATSLKELKVLFETSKQATDIDLDYVGKAEDLLMKTPTKKRRSSESSSPVSVVKQKSDLSAAPAPMAAKSPKVENESIKVTLGASKRSFDKVGIKSIETGFELNVIRGDLFKTSTDKTCLAHCVSRDLKMNKGIAKLFRDKFGRIGELEKSKSDIGDVAVLKDGNRYIYNLVTKDKYNGFPTYETLRQSLVSMRNHALKNNVKEIAMPKLACGLDKLNWSAVRTLIKNVFFDDKIKITVYHLDNDATTTKHKVVIDEDVDEGPSSTKKPKKNEKKHSYPILDIAEGNLTPITDDQKKNNNDENSDTKSGKKTKCVALKYETLPDVFLGDKIFLQNGVQNEGKMKRYIISYGGEVVDELEFSDANVVVKAANVDQKKPLVNGFGLLAKKKAPQVTEKWLLDSIMSQKRQPLNNYHV